MLRIQTVALAMGLGAILWLAIIGAFAVVEWLIVRFSFIPL